MVLVSLSLLRVFSLRRSTVRTAGVPIRVSGQKEKELVPLTPGKRNIQTMHKKTVSWYLQFFFNLPSFIKEMYEIIVICLLPHGMALSV